MNPASLKDALRLAGGYRVSKAASLVACPPAVFLTALAARFGKKFAFGSQDASWEKSGAFTGEISPLMLKGAGAKYALLGHSERRKHLGETDEMVGKKVKACFDSGLIPIVCLGGGLKPRDKESAVRNLLKYQLSKAFESAGAFFDCVLAYEPTWAISTQGGRIVEPEHVSEISIFLKKIFEKIAGIKTSSKTPVIYGGSVTGKNGRAFFESSEIDGLLVGAASLDPESFNRLLE